MAEEQMIFPDGAAKQVVDVGNALKSTDDALIKFTKDSERLIELLKQQNISFEQLTAIQKKAQKTTQDVDKVGKQLIQSEERLKQITDERQKQIVANQKLTQNQKRDIQLLTRARQAERGSIEQLSAVNAILEKRLKSVNIQTEEGRKRAERLRGAIDRNTKTIMANSSQYSKWKINVGNYQSALSGLSPTFGRVSAAAGQANKAFKLLLANPVVLVISAIVAAFAGLVAIFKSTDDGGTKLQGVFDGIKNVLGVLKNALTQVIEAFSLIREGKFREAFRAIGDAAKYAADNVKDAYEAGYEYAQALDAVNDRITANISGQARTLRQFREYIALSKDQTLTDQERIDNLDKAQKAAEEYFGTRRQDAQDLFDLEVKNLAARTKLTAEELEQFISLDGKRAEEARKNNENIANAWNVLGDENIKTLEEMYAAALEADTDYFKRTSEITSLRTGLIKKQNAERLKAEEETLNEITDLRQRQSIDEVDFEIEQQELQTERLLQLNKERQEALRVQEEEEFKRKAEMYQAFTNVIANSFYDFAQGNEDALKEGAKAVVTMALEVLKAQTQMAVVGATVQSLAQPDSIATFGLAGLARAAILTGLIEAAFATVEGLVQGFATGTENAPGRFVAGEKGRELMYLKTGEIMMVDKPTYFEGNKYKGATIKTNSETEKIIAQSAKGNNFVFDTSDLKKEMQLTRKAIQKKPVAITDKSGRIVGKQGANYREIYLNRMRNGR